MRRLARTGKFKRDYKLARKRHGDLPDRLQAVLEGLSGGEVLPERFRDHALKGAWSGFRECHVKPDLLLVYRVTDEELTLVRLGSHSDLF